MVSRAAFLAGLLALFAVACGGGSGPGERFPTVIPLGEGELFPVINNSSLALGENRLSLSLLDDEDSFILGALVRVRLFDLSDQEPALKSETAAEFIGSELFYIDEAGREKRIVGSSGVYAARVQFDRAGPWGMEVLVTHEGREYDPIPFRFDVREETPEPGIGDPVPPSRQLTTSDVDDVSEIDSSYPPRPHLHDITVADALATGRPLVVAFATPAFCETRTCGPVMETVMDPLYEKYSDRAVFIHIEPYKLSELREGIGEVPVEATEEWALPTEPWIFVVDGEGKVAAKFEGIASAAEVEEALLGTLAEG